MRTDIAIPAVDRNGMPFDVWLTSDGCTLREGRRRALPWRLCRTRLAR